MDVTQIQSTQTLLEKGPMSFVAAFFAITTFAMLWLYVRAKESHRLTQAQDSERFAKEMAEQFKASLERAMQMTQAVTLVGKLADDLQDLLEHRTRKRPKPSPGVPKIPSVLPVENEE